MSKMSDALLNSLSVSASPMPKTIEEEPNFLARQYANRVSNAMNYAGGLLGNISRWLKGAGVMSNFAEQQRIEENARRLENMGLYEQANEYRKNPGKGAYSLGNEIVNNGEWLSDITENINKKYGSKPEYEDLGVLDRLTNLDYLTDVRGLQADAFQGLGSSTLSLLALPFAPEVTLARGALATAGKYAPKLLGDGFTAASKNTIGATLDNVLGYGLNPLAAPLDAFSNAGETVTEHRMQGRTDAEIAPIIGAQALNEVPYDMVNQGIFGSVMGGKLFAPAKKRAGRMAQQAASVPIEMGSEYFQEGTQQRLSNEYLGKPYGTWYALTDDEKRASTMGAIGSILTAGAGAARGAYKNWNLPKAEGFSDNFDKWESRPGATDLDNVRPEIKGALNSIAQELGNGGKITITGGAEKGYHASGEFGHEGGWKVDIDKNSITDPQKFFALCEKYGIAVGDEGDHYDLSAHKEGSTGGKRVATPSTFLSDMLNGGGNVTAGKREGHENAWAIYDVFKNAGYNDNAIAGILGRVQQEHNFDTGNVEEYDDAETGLHLGGYGMFQWNGGRTTAFLNWTKENNLDPQNARVQAQYALLEARQRGLTPEKMNSLSDEDAATLWTDEWEIGKHGDERKYAKEWAERIAKGGNINSQNNISANNNVDTSLIDGVEAAQDNSALIKQLNDIMAEGEIGLSNDQRMALINMATEQKQIPLPNATPQEEEAYYREIDDAINNGDYKTIAQMFPQQAARILGINPINTATPKIDALKQEQKEGEQQPKEEFNSQIDRQPIAQIQEQQQVQQPAEQNVIQPMSQNIAGDIENIISQIRSGTFNTGAKLNTNQQAVLDLLQPTQNVIETPTQDGLSAGLTAAQKVAQANAAIANFRANEEARAQEEQPAPTVRKYHFDGTQQAQEQAEETAPIATQDEIIPQEQAETQNRRQLKPMREMYDNAKNVFKNFRDASDAIIAGYEGGYVGRDEAEEMLRQGHSDLRGNLTTKKNANAYDKLLDASIARLNNTKPMQAQATETSYAMETSAANRVNDIREYYNERKEEYRLFELDELEARRKRYIKERLDHYNKNPGGQGTTSVLLDENGKQLGTEGVGYDAVRREAVSNNPEWYQRAYALLGRKPAKKDYEYIAETDLSEWQPAEVQADWQALNEVIEEKKNEEQIKAEPKNVQKFRKDVNQKVRKFKEKLKTTKNKEVSRDNYLAKIKEMHDNALRVATQDETRAAMEEAYNNAVGEINRVYNDVTSQRKTLKSQRNDLENQNKTLQGEQASSKLGESQTQVSAKSDESVENTAQAKSAQNSNVASEATTEEPQTKKAANEGGQENAGEASNTENNKTEKDGIVVTGNEFGEYKDIKELRAKAREYYKNNLQGTSVENPILGKVNLTDYSIDFTKRGIDKAISTSAKEHKLLLVKYLPELIKNATQVSARENKKNKREASQYTYLYTTARIDGKEQPVEITIFTDVNGNRYYNHILPLEEKNKRNSPVYPAQASASEDGIPAVSQQVPSVDSTIPQTEPTSKDKNEKDLQALYREAMTTVTDGKGKASLKEQGQKLITIAEYDEIAFDEKLKKNLKSGYKKAIKEAQDKIRSERISKIQAKNKKRVKAEIEKIGERYKNGGISKENAEREMNYAIDKLGAAIGETVTFVKFEDKQEMIALKNKLLSEKPTTQNTKQKERSQNEDALSNGETVNDIETANTADEVIEKSKKIFAKLNKTITDDFTPIDTLEEAETIYIRIRERIKELANTTENFSDAMDSVRDAIGSLYDNRIFKIEESEDGKKYYAEYAKRSKNTNTAINKVADKLKVKYGTSPFSPYRRFIFDSNEERKDFIRAVENMLRNEKKKKDNNKLNQDTRGIYDTANNIVTLTENADESTFIHEMGHHYYNVLKQAAEISGKGSQAAKDVETIDNWANYKKGMAAEYEDTASEKEFADLEKEITEAEEKGDTKKADELKARWRQERFARGFEEYLSEGIAPTAKLRKIFDNFKKWLKEIYRGLRGAGAKPSEDVRAVMERMIASDKEILSGKASRLTGDTKAAYDKALADLKAAGAKDAETNAYIAAKITERLSSAYKEAGEDRSAVSLLPEIQAQEKSAQNEKEAVRKKYEGTKEWLKAPNGEDTNLTEDQWLTVRTPSFKKWFGDWENDPKNASKVVDENGEPLVVYHGTKFEGFTEFEETSKGIFFSNEDRASWYTADDYPQIIHFPPTFTSWEDVKNYADKIGAKFSEADKDEYEDGVFLINDELVYDFETAREIFQEINKNRGDIGSIYACFLNIKNPNYKNAKGKYAINYNQLSHNKKQDGVIVENINDPTFDAGSDFEATNYIVFNSNQIKSATDNNGEFNENNPSILHQKPAKSPIDNNVEMKDNIINDYLTIKANGSFVVKLLNEKPPLRTESEKERIHRRKEEVINMDKLLNVKENPDAYAELLSDHTVDAIEKRLNAEQISYDKLAKEFLAQYNSNLAKYSEIVDENRVIGSLYILKGAMRYAKQQGNITRRNQPVSRNERNAGRNISEVGRTNTETTKQLNTETAKHSNTSAFSITEKPSKVNGKESTFFSVDSDLMDVSGHIPQGGIPFIDNLWYNEKYASDPTDISTISPNVLRKGNATKHILSVINYLKDKGHNTFQVKTMSEYSNALMKSLERKGYIKAKAAWKYEGDNVTYDILNIAEEKHFNQGAFSIAEKGGKFTAKLNAIPKGKEKQLANIAGLHHGKVNGDTFTFDNEGERVEFIRKAEAFLSTADEDTKLKFSVDAWHGNGLYELIDKFSLKYLGTGEGAQVHGWGLYFAKSREVGEGYRNKLNLDNDKYYIVNGKEISLYDTNAYLDLSSSSKIAIGALRLHKDNAMKAISELESWQHITNEEKINAIELLKDGKVKGSEKNKHGGHLYHVQIPDEDVMLDEQKPLSEQPPGDAVWEALTGLTNKQLEKWANRWGLIPKGETNASKDELVDRLFRYMDTDNGGQYFYNGLANIVFEENRTNNPKAASEYLKKYGIKGITYDGQQDGRCYVVFDDNAVDIIEKFSAEKLKENSIAKLAAKADIVKMEDLTVEEKRFMEMGEKLGTPVVWVSADPRLNGWHKDGVTFINRNRRMTGEQTFWHEALHFILQNEDGLLSELADTVGITDKQIEVWKNKTGRFELSREEVVEEMLCDAFHDPASRVKVFQEIAGKNPSLMEKIMAWINRLKEEFFDAFRGVQGKLTQSQKNNMTRVIDNHFKNLKGKDGKPLFKKENGEWIFVWHGNGREEYIDKFDLKYIGTGEGAQLHGYGHYFAKERKIAEENYRDALSSEGLQIETPETRYQNKGYAYVDLNTYEGVSLDEDFAFDYFEKANGDVNEAIKMANKELNDPQFDEDAEFIEDAINLLQTEAHNWKIREGKMGHIYRVRIPHPKYMLDEQKKLSEQTPEVKKALNDYAKKIGDWTFTFGEMEAKDTGKSFYKYISEILGSDKAASEYLNNAGVKGITYEGREDGRCYVIFADDNTHITERYSAEGENRAKSPIENTDNVGDNEKKITLPRTDLSNETKQHLFRNISNNIDSYIQEQIRAGEKREDITKELTVENPAHRAKLFGKTKAIIQDLKARAKDPQAKKNLLKTIVSDSSKLENNLEDTYQAVLKQMQEVLDYGNFLYEEIALNRYANARNRERRVELVSWKSAEAQHERRKEDARLKREQQNTTNTKHSANIAGASFSASVDNVEAEQGIFEKAAAKLAKKMGLKSDIVKVEAEKADTNDISMVNYLLRSPSRIKGTFGLFFRMGKKAMDTLTKNRSDFLRKLDAALNTVKTDKEKQDLYDVLLRGDAEQKEFTKEELTRDYGENVANAYIGVRRLMTKAYRMLNDARRKPVIWTKRYTDKQLDELKNNKFVEIKSVGEKESDGRRKVTYKEYQNYEHKGLVVDKETLDRFESDEDMQVIFKHDNGDGTFTVSYREGMGNVNKLTGYIPHFFHNYMIRVKDGEGKTILTLGSGKTEREAIKKAEEWVKNNKLETGQQVYISPKTFNFEALGMDESQSAVVVGDKDYKKMMNSIAEGNDLTLDEAKDLLNGSVKMKNRHRFLGNLLQRKGVAGYETDLPWVLRHYLNSVARYHALETEFKPQAISLFERLFGDFNKEHKGLAQYVKDYIGDINGNPSAVEEVLNKALRNNILFKYFITPYFGDRAALQLSNTLTNWTSMLCLGYLNTSSALLNLSQCINAAGYLGSPKYAGKIIAAGFKRYGKMTSSNGELKRKDMPFYQYNLKERKILLETNVANDIGLDSGSGYDINRGYAGKALGAIGKISQKGMILFKTTEQAMRRGTVLVAYEKARAEGKKHKQAIAYAKEINEKSNFDYGVADAPNIFRRGSIFSQLLLQFKKYGFKELEVMADMCSNATGSKQKLAFWGMYFIVCGLLQVPALDWLDKLLGENMKTFVQKSIMEVCGDSAIGQIIGKTAMYGVLSNLGVDISARAGMADVIPTDLKSLLQGPTISRAGGIVEEGGNLAMSLVSDGANGSVASFVRALSPGMYNIYSAATGEKVGKRDRVTSYYEGAWERILRAAGFQSTDERISSDMERIVSKERSGLTKEKQEAVDAFIANPTGANAKRLKELGVSPKTVKQERERKKQDRAGRMKGKMTAEEQKRYKEMMKFAE